MGTFIAAGKKRPSNSSLLIQEGVKNFILNGKRYPTLQTAVWVACNQKQTPLDVWLRTTGGNLFRLLR